MPISRRQLLAGAGGLAGLQLLTPIVARTGGVLGQPVDPALARRRRLVVLFLAGGNDGLNTVVPTADVPGAARHSVYRKVRPSLAYAPERMLPLDRAADAGHGIGLNPKLVNVHRMYREGRVAVVQGVDYPKHSYSHFTSQDIWQSGEPERVPGSGWLGRHLDRAGTSEGELRAVGIGNDLPLILRGRSRLGMQILSVPATRFPDGTSDAARARHAALARFARHPEAEPLRAAVGRTARATVRVVDTLQKATVPPTTGNRLADAIITSRVLLEEQLGVEVVFIAHGGYDTHAGQVAQQERLLGEVDAAVHLLWTGQYNGTQVIPPMPAAVADRTLFMTFSEFGRRIGENGVGAGAGTDHGASAPMLLVGPPGGGNAASGGRLVAGVHGDHPNMGTVALPADNLAMTTDLRRVYQAVLTHWLGDPDPMFERQKPLPGLFA